MKAHAPITKTLTKTVDSTISNLTTTFRGLPRRLRGAGKLVSTFSDDALRYIKRHPARAIASLLVVGVAARKLARRV